MNEDIVSICVNSFAVAAVVFHMTSKRSKPRSTCLNFIWAGDAIDTTPSVESMIRMRAMMVMKMERIGKHTSWSCTTPKPMAIKTTLYPVVIENIRHSLIIGENPAILHDTGARRWSST